MADFWLENASTKPPPHVIVDLGYAHHSQVRDRADELMKMLGKQNLQVVYLGRVLVRIPPIKVRAVLMNFPNIEERCTYSWCTHSWIPAGGGDLKHTDNG